MSGWTQNLHQGSRESLSYPFQFVSECFHAAQILNHPHEPLRLALALVCFVLLMAWKAPPWVVVIVAAAGGVVISSL